MLLAETNSGVNWEVIISAVGVILVQLYSMYLSHLRSQVVIEKVEEIHKATNSMKDQLVEVTKDAATLQGGVDERARADAKAEAKSGDNSTVKEEKVEARYIEVKKDSG